MFAFVGDTVLDPFAGSGTTSLAAKNLGRNSIGYEINPEFIPVIRQKLRADEKDIDGTSYQFFEHKSNLNYSKEIERSPYIFNDPHKLDLKVDPKKLQFGSKIDKNSSAKREEFFTVKEVISPEKLRLSNDLTVRLIGIKEDPVINGKATSFLVEKTKGKKVFMKYDEVKYDKDNNLLCYLYLENKTFINAHLIKNGLARVDERASYKYKNKFINLHQGINGE